MHNILKRFPEVRPDCLTANARQPLLLVRTITRLIGGLLLPTVATFLVFAGQANPRDKLKPWVEKDWTQWTPADCLYVLNGSPWILQTLENLPSYGPLRDYKMSIVQLRSALPIRQALLRQIQLQKHYDEMSADDRIKFDELHTLSLPGAERGNIVIVIRNGSVEPPQPLKRNNPLPDVRIGPEPIRQAALLSQGTFVQPIELSMTSYPFTQVNEYTNQFEYVFPRTTGGRPLYTSADALLHIELGEPLILDKKLAKVDQQDFRSAGLVFEFKISDLIYKGKLEY
jgi:hypothetical protein